MGYVEGALSSAVIRPAQQELILRALSKVWTALGQEEKQQGKPTVLRASAMTLIVATDEEDGGFSASQTISELMHEQPSRGIVLVVSERAEKGLEARVLAQCWKPFGKAQRPLRLGKQHHPAIGGEPAAIEGGRSLATRCRGRDPARRGG